jgi:hypothetical protein
MRVVFVKCHTFPWKYENYLELVTDSYHCTPRKLAAVLFVFVLAS